MVAGVVTVPAGASVAQVAQDDFLRSGYGSYPVERAGTVVGLLSQKDVLHLSVEERASTSVQGAMRPLNDDIVTDPDVPLTVAIAKMAQGGDRAAHRHARRAARGPSHDEWGDSPPEGAGESGSVTGDKLIARPAARRTSLGASGEWRGFEFVRLETRVDFAPTAAAELGSRKDCVPDIAYPPDVARRTWLSYQATFTVQQPE